MLPLSESGRRVYDEDTFENEGSFKLDEPEYWFIPQSDIEQRNQLNRSQLHTQEEWEANGRPRDWISGVFYIHGQKRKGKAHKLFLRLLPATFEFLLKGQPERGPTLPVLHEAIDCFHELADQLFDPEPPEGTRIEDLLPFAPKGRDRQLKHKLRLRHGDVVYYREEGENVVEVSFSAIWRTANRMTDADRKVRGLRVYDFINEISPEFLPYNPRRKYLSPAEAVFGCVSAEAADEDARFVCAYASRLRFGFGHIASKPGLKGSESEDSYYMSPVTLKQLSSPKLPCPSMYFTPKYGQGGYIAKHELNLNDHQPQGRKLYLHQPDAQTSDPYRSRVPERIVDLEKKSHQQQELENRRNQIKNHMNVKPLPPETTFFFHVDFDNLTDSELEGLCFALRPSEGFHHKLGLGKPLGLGSVQIEPVGAFFVNRRTRYGKESVFSKTRYHTMVRKEGKDWPEAYRIEKTCHAVRIITAFRKFRDRFSAKHPKVAYAIKALGAWNENGPKVHYPPNSGLWTSALSEDKLYEWFVANDDGGSKGMKANTNTST